MGVSGDGEPGFTWMNRMNGMDRIFGCGLLRDCYVVRQAHHERLRPRNGGGGGFHPHPNPLPSRERGRGRGFTWMNRMNGMDRIFGCGLLRDCYVVRQAHHERLRSWQWHMSLTGFSPSPQPSPIKGEDVLRQAQDERGVRGGVNGVGLIDMAGGVAVELRPLHAGVAIDRM